VCVCVCVCTCSRSSPLVLASQPYGKEADSYSFGMVIWECFGRALPYAEEKWDSTVEEFIRSGVRPPIPKSMPPVVAQLVQRCWAPSPADRPPCEEILATLEDWQL
jgi:serine/threonine protein kinase